MTTETAYERMIDALESHGSRVKTKPNDTAEAQCPAHDDHTPSLVVTAIEGAVLIFCRAGCENRDIVAALDMTLADLYDKNGGADYHYTDLNGKTERTAHRRTDDAETGKKRFWQSGKTTGPTMFYHLPRVVAAVAEGRKVHLVEGEKDVHALESIGAVATTAPMGASNFHKCNTKPLHGADIIAVVDKDAAGKTWMEAVFTALDGKARSLAFFEALSGKDSADHIAAGHSVDEFVPMRTNEPRNVSTKPKKVVGRKASDLPEGVPPTFLAIGWLPRGGVTVLAGDEGIGKSLFWVYVVAHVTTGREVPEIGLPARGPANVILVSTEDSWPEVKARLLLAGADLDRVYLISEDDDGTGSPVFPRDMTVIANLAAEVDPALVVLDSWLDTVDGNIIIKDGQQARNALHPWGELAAKHQCAVMLLAHTNRERDASIRDRMGATAALRQKARMLLFAAAEVDGEGAQLFIGPDKANSTGQNKAVRFDIKIHQVRPATISDPGTVAVLARPVLQDRKISALIRQWRADQRESAKPPSADEKATAWLRDYMADNDYRVESKVGQAAASEAKHNTDRVARCLKDFLGGNSLPDHEKGGVWWWTAPRPQVSQPPTESYGPPNTWDTWDTWQESQVSQDSQGPQETDTPWNTWNPDRAQQPPTPTDTSQANGRPKAQGTHCTAPGCDRPTRSSQPLCPGHDWERQQRAAG